MREVFEAVRFVNRLLDKLAGVRFFVYQNLYALVDQARPICEDAGITLNVPRIRGKCWVVEFYKVYFDKCFGLACKLVKQPHMPVIRVNVDGSRFAVYIMQQMDALQLPPDDPVVYVKSSIEMCPVCGGSINLLWRVIDRCDLCNIEFHTFSPIWRLRKRDSGFVILR